VAVKIFPGATKVITQKHLPERNLRTFPPEGSLMNFQ
jgi:hypothetical protein